MGARTSRNDSARRRSFIPELEVLEGRCCPTVTSTFKGGVLTITGNGDDDVVAITAQNKAITVVADGTTTTFNNVKAINVNLDGGNDQLTVDLSGSTAKDLVVNANTGAGNDQVAVTLGAVQANARLDLAVNL